MAPAATTKTPYLAPSRASASTCGRGGDGGRGAGAWGRPAVRPRARGTGQALAEAAAAGGSSAARAPASLAAPARSPPALFSLRLKLGWTELGWFVGQPLESPTRRQKDGRGMPVEGVSFRGQGRGVPGGGGGGGGGLKPALGLKGAGMRQVAGGPRESFELADEKRFQALRKRLTDEGYTQVLGFESAPLVHRLFDDLCALRDTQATMAHNLSEKTANEAKLQRQVHPIQKELSRMVRENNQLHLELIQRGEILDTHQRKSALDTKKLQTKITDQAFIITQQAQHIRDLEKQLDEHRARMQQLLDPNFTCTSGPAGDVIPKGQDIMVSACPRPHETEDDHGEAAVAQVVHDLDSSTAQQIAMLEEELQESRKTQEALEHDVLAMQDAIRNRENEITRMGRLLVTNVNSDKEDLERINAGNEDIIRRLETQLDFVSGQLADAERQKLQVQELAEEVENLRAREAKLESMLLSANAEVQELRALLQQPAGPARTGGGVPTPAKAGPGGEVHQTVGPAPEEAAREGQHNHAGRTDVDAANRKRLELRIGELEVALEERDADCMKLREQMLLGDQRLSENEAKCEQVGMELAEMKRLRDNLYAVVWDFENQMAEVQVKIKDLVSAREEKARQCSQAMDKVRSLQEQLAKASSGAGSSHAHAQQVSQLLDELSEYRERVQDLEAQVERADHELAAWAANDTSNGESSNSAASNVQMLSLRNEINGLKTSLSASEREVQSVRAQLQKVTSENQELSSHMEPMESKLAEKERAIEQLQSLMSNMDETRGQVVSQLKVHMESSQTSKQQSELLEAEVKRLLGELRRYEDELARQKTAVTDVDGERDALLNQLDEKTQMVRTLEGRLSEALKDQHTSLADVTSVQQQADMLRQALNERDAQYKALQMDLRDEMQQRSGAEQLCNAKMEEARVLAAVILPAIPLMPSSYPPQHAVIARRSMLHAGCEQEQVH